MIKKIIISFFILFFFVYICNSQNNNVIKTIKLNKKNGGTFEIPCKINGLPMTFIFDTGASDVSISLTEAGFMLKNGYLSEHDFTGVQKYKIANGDIQEGYTLIIKEIEFEGLTLYNVKASVVNSLDAPLLLGQSALSKLGKILIDYDNNTLTILKSSYSSSDYQSNNTAKKQNTQKRPYDKKAYRIAKKKVRKTIPYKYVFQLGDGLYTNLGATQNLTTNIDLVSYNYSWTDTYGFFRKVGIKEKFTTKKKRDISRATLIGIFAEIGYHFDNKKILTENGVIKTEFGAILWQWVRISGGIINYNWLHNIEHSNYSGTLGLNIKLYNFQIFANYNQITDKSFDIFNSYINFGLNYNINLFRKIPKNEKENLKNYY